MSIHISCDERRSVDSGVDVVTEEVYRGRQEKTEDNAEDVNLNREGIGSRRGRPLDTTPRYPMDLHPDGHES